MLKRQNTCKFKRVSRRTIHIAPALAVLGALLGLGWSSYAFVSLQAGALPMFWASSTVTFTAHQAGDPTITDGSDLAAVRLAFQAWENVGSSRIAFIEDRSNQARTDWRADDLHLVVWDTSNESGFFGGTAGLVAITPVDFDPRSGQILDADIVFNAKNYKFSTDLTGGTFDIQSIATHEVGHFIGLDHSAVIGATMNPFASTQDTRLRTLEQDDIAGASAIYPISSPPGVIEGTITRNGQPVSGAHVVAEDVDGVPCSAGLSDGAGNFRIAGLEQGQYVVYAEPLDGPVRSGNFSLQTSGLTIDTNFGTTFFGAGTGGRSSPANPDRVSVSFGQTTRLPRTIEALPRLPQGATQPMNVLSISTLAVAPASDATLSVSGTGLDRANAFEVPGNGLFPAGQPTFASTSASRPFEIGGAAQTTVRTVRLYNDQTWECTVLTGGFEVRLPAPRAEGLEPATGKAGTSVQVFGEGFRPGARVVIGGEVVLGFNAGGAVSFTVPALTAGSYTVAVENPDGQFTALKGAFTLEGQAAPAGGSTATSSGPADAGSIQVNTSPAPQPAVSAAQASSPPPVSGGGGGGGGGGCALAPSSPRAVDPSVLLLLAALLLVRGRREA